MSSFQRKTRCPGNFSRVLMIALMMDAEFGKVSFQGAPLWNLGSIKELIPPDTCEQSVTVLLHFDLGLRTDPNGLR